MKRIVFLLFIFGNFNLYAENTVGRIIWELRNYPEKYILEIEFKADMPERFAYSKGCIDDNLWRGYKYGWETAYNTPGPVRVAGVSENFTVRIEYSRVKDFPQFFLLSYMGGTENPNNKNFPLVIEYFIKSFWENDIGNYRAETGFSWNDEELTWLDPNPTLGYQRFRVVYVIYEET